MTGKTSHQDIVFIKETLRLAKKGMGWTFPNPMVGAVIVRDGKIIGRGYHKKVGFPHAEVEALRSLKTTAKGATLYVNLEPCSHVGKTSPCVAAIIQRGIKRVVCCSLDPNPKVYGKGVAMLQEAGIQVDRGIGEKEARALNEAFFIFHEKKRPFVALKFAASLDGKIATRTGDSQWITNEKARSFARALRGQYQAILIGITTVLTDDPHLGVRMKGKKDPLRIILDCSLKIPLTSQVLRDANVLIATTTKANKKKKSQLEKQEVPILTFDSKSIPLKKLLQELTKIDIISILVEGGGSVLGSFMDEKLVDKLYAFSAPIIIGGEKGIGAIGGAGAGKVAAARSLTHASFRRFDDNFLVSGDIS